MQAVACISVRCQERMHADVSAYIASLVTCGAYLPLCLLHHTMYDETPLKLRADFSATSGGDPQTSKVFVVTNAFSYVLRKASSGPVEAKADKHLQDHLVIKTHMMPALRCFSGTTGEHIASVLSSTTLPLPQVTQQFADRALVLRVAESDAFSGNMRAERLLQQSRGHELVHMTCLAHKTHGAAQRTFELAPQTLRGTVRTGLVTRQAGVLGQFRSWLRCFIQQRAHLSHTAAQIDASSKNYRAYLVEFFRPRSARKKATTDIIFTLLNGDLREPQILCHHCRGRHCCLNKGLIEKLTFWLLRWTP